MALINYKAEGVVFDIQRFSLHDGPGIRTIVFLKGCPLSCLWCCNPESQQAGAEMMYEQEKCIHCGKCLRTCKQGAISTDNPDLIDRSKCIGCGECASVCLTGALVLKGERMTVQDVVQILKRDTITYRKSGGGITLSGGEPLMQWEFATELLKACKAQGFNTAIETTGFGSEQAIESVFPYVDHALLDIKSMDDEVHKKVTGVSNERIHHNAVRISELAGDTVIRVPTIPTINAFSEQFEQIARFAKTLHEVKTIHVLPYHVYGENKYKLLGQEYMMGYDIKPLPREEAEGFKRVVEAQGLSCVIGG